jgi:hypothetical protein
VLDLAIMDLRAPLDLTIDPAQAAEALEQMCVTLLQRAAAIADTRYCVVSTLCEYNTAGLHAGWGKYDNEAVPLVWSWATWVPPQDRRRPSPDRLIALLPRTSAPRATSPPS